MNAKISLSSEVASSTIALKSALNDAQKAKEDAEKKYASLLKKHEMIQNQLKNFEQRAKEDKYFSDVFDKFKVECPDCAKFEILPKSLPFASFDKNIEKVQNSLNELEAINKQIQPIK